MKELSIEEKAKAYDSNYKNYAELINRLEDVKEAIKKQNYGIAMDVLCKSYPEFQVTTHSELKEESEGERIRKRICKLLWDNAPYEEAQEYIAWLEKQGNPTEDELEALRMAAYEPTKNWSEKLQSLYEKLTHCEQKPANKVEPKFRIGDNIEPIDTCLGSSRTIYKICDGFYETNQGTLDFEFENNWRLIEQKPAWTEEDKKIIKRIKSLLYAINESDFENIYAWLEFLKNRVQPKQEWSKEDEGYYDAIIAKLEVTREDALLTDNEMDFLKSLEGRVFPKSTWNEEDEKVIHCLEYTIRHFYVDEDTIEWCCDWLKSLRPQNRWKPSEEQMRVLDLAIRCGINRGTTEETTLVSLFNDLKKLI